MVQGSVVNFLIKKSSWERRGRIVDGFVETKIKKKTSEREGAEAVVPDAVRAFSPCFHSSAMYTYLTVSLDNLPSDLGASACLCSLCILTSCHLTKTDVCWPAPLALPPHHPEHSVQRAPHGEYLPGTPPQIWLPFKFIHGSTQHHLCIRCFKKIPVISDSSPANWSETRAATNISSEVVERHVFLSDIGKTAENQGWFPQLSLPPDLGSCY